MVWPRIRRGPGAMSSPRPRATATKNSALALRREVKMFFRLTGCVVFKEMGSFGTHWLLLLQVESVENFPLKGSRVSFKIYATCGCYCETRSGEGHGFRGMTAIEDSLIGSYYFFCRVLGIEPSFVNKKVYFYTIPVGAKICSRCLLNCFAQKSSIGERIWSGIGTLRDYVLRICSPVYEFRERERTILS